VAFSPDGTRLATGGAGRSPRVRVGDTASGRQLPEVRHGTFVTAAAASSPDGTRLATGSLDRSVRIWSAAES
jgi:WD40 repeat protein